MPKGNLKSVRLTDDLIELIERQAGDTFTAKLENLVTRCVWELPEREKELERIQDQIRKERQRLRDLQNLYRKLLGVYNDLNRKMLAITASVNIAIQELKT